MSFGGYPIPSGVSGTAPFIVKVRFGRDIRRITVHNTDLTFDDLVLMLQRVFRDALIDNSNILIKYEDEDGDLITMTNNSDLGLATAGVSVLRLTVFREDEEINRDPTISEIRHELQTLTKAIANLVTKLDTLTAASAAASGGSSSSTSSSSSSAPPPSASNTTSSTAAPTKSSASATPAATTSAKPPGSVLPPPASPLKIPQSAEFDPLKSAPAPAAAGGTASGDKDPFAMFGKPAAAPSTTPTPQQAPQHSQTAQGQGQAQAQAPQQQPQSQQQPQAGAGYQQQVPYASGYGSAMPTFSPPPYPAQVGTAGGATIPTTPQAQQAAQYQAYTQAQQNAHMQAQAQQQQQHGQTAPAQQGQSTQQPSYYGTAASATPSQQQQGYYGQNPYGSASAPPQQQQQQQYPGGYYRQ